MIHQRPSAGLALVLAGGLAVAAYVLTIDVLLLSRSAHAAESGKADHARDEASGVACLTGKPSPRPEKGGMQYVRIYTDSDGGTRFEDLKLELKEVDFAPPAPPVQLSAFTSANQWAFFVLPPGWKGDWHPTPKRQVFFYLAGQTDIEVADGTIRRFGPGDAILVEDTTGRGHRSCVVGDETAIQAVVQMPDEE